MPYLSDAPLPLGQNISRNFTNIIICDSPPPNILGRDFSVNQRQGQSSTASNAHLAPDMRPDIAIERLSDSTYPPHPLKCTVEGCSNQITFGRASDLKFVAQSFSSNHKLIVPESTSTATSNPILAPTFLALLNPSAFQTKAPLLATSAKFTAAAPHRIHALHQHVLDIKKVLHGRQI